MSRRPYSEGAFSWEVGRAVKLSLSRRSVGFKSRALSVRGRFVTRAPVLDYLGIGPEECLIIEARVGAVKRETYVARSLLADIRDEPNEASRSRRWENHVNWVALTVLAGLVRAMFDAHERTKAHARQLAEARR